MTLFENRAAVSASAGRVGHLSRLALGLGLALTLAATFPAFAATTSQVRAIRVDAQNSQIVFTLSTANTGQLISPIDHGQRRFILDIPGATLSSLGGKARILQTITSQLPDIYRVTLDEFRMPDPLVRMVLLPKNPQLTASLQNADDKTLILQLIQPYATNELMSKTMSSVTNVSDTNAEPASPRVMSPKEAAAYNRAATTNTGSGEYTTNVQAETAPDTGNPVITGQTTIVSTLELDRKAFELESIRRQRNLYEDQIKNLKILTNQQNEMIQHLKRVQGDLTAKTPNAVEKQTIMKLEKQIEDFQKSYSELLKVVDQHRLEVTALETQLQTARNDNQGLVAQLDKANNLRYPDPAEVRGGLLNSLADLDKLSFGKLVEAERAYRDGRKAEAAKNDTRAELSYRKAVDYSPLVAEYRVALGELLIRAQRYPEAKTVLIEGLNAHPNDSDLNNSLGKVGLLTADYNASLKYFSHALPSAALSNYASTLRRVNRNADAEALYKLAIAASPDDSDLQFNLGNLYLKQKRYTDAQDRFTQAIRVNPKFAEAQFHLGLALSAQAKNKMALDAFNNYLKILPNAPNRTVVEDYIHDLEFVSTKPTNQ